MHEAMEHDYLSFIVCGANIAGHLEQAQQICVPDDDVLTDFLVREEEDWQDMVSSHYLDPDAQFMPPPETWAEYIDYRLREEFGEENDNG